MKLVDALRQNNTVTENGMATNSSSLNACVDLFFTIGAMRGQDKTRLISKFSLALLNDSNRALKILFWVRDIRGGAGERQIFKDIMVYLAENHPDFLKKNIPYISEYGRWDDLLTLVGTKLEKEAFAQISWALENKNGLAAKWMPRKGPVANKLRQFLEMSPKQYRKTLVELTNVVETQMCSNEWEKIDFGKLPSVASARYQKAFWKRNEAGYKAYIAALQKGEAKINASAVYPYDVTKSLQRGNVDVSIEQWKALPNYMEGSNERILPVVDVSGSMGCPAGGNKNVTCMDVSLSLGLYISERNEGVFKDAFITFSANPTLQYLKGNLRDRFNQLASAEWGMNTNVERVFDLILDQAKKNSVPESEMPTKILILSDMEFDSANGSRGGYYGRTESSSWNPTAQQMIEQKYASAGYKMPQIVYWNIQSRGDNVPVAFDKTGTALISGFSPSILKSVIKGELTTPVAIMDETILSPRYEAIKA
jgi:hypothetical protein